MLPCVLLTSCSSSTGVAQSKLQDGDIIFQTSLSNQSKAIQLATHSKYSHMGIIYRRGGACCVFEAVGPVKSTPLQEWIDRGEKKEYAVKRMGGAGLSADAIAKLRKVGAQYAGKLYDQYFGWSDDKIYCSELVWKVYKSALGVELCKLKKLGDFDLSHPAVQGKLRERYGSKIPLSEQTVTPSDIFDSPLLEDVR